MFALVILAARRYKSKYWRVYIRNTEEAQITQKTAGAKLTGNDGSADYGGVLCQNLARAGNKWIRKSKCFAQGGLSIRRMDRD